MFREQYHTLNGQVAPDAALLKATLLKAQRAETQSPHKAYALRKPAMVLASLCLCAFLAMPVLAATVEPVYTLLYTLSPALAQFFIPVQKSDVDNGIKMDVVSAYLEGNVVKIYLTMQDLTENRIDATTDLFDSYSINRPFDSTGYCQRVAYDESTKTATFLVTLEAWGEKDITGEKITFQVKEFLSHKQAYDGIEIPVTLAAVSVANETQRASNLTGWGSTQLLQHSEQTPTALVPQPPLDKFPVEGIDFTGIGYIDGKLHIQTAVDNPLDNDNHGFFYLKDSNGNKIDESYRFSFATEPQQGKRVDYCNYVFDVPQAELAGYTLYGDFVTSGMLTKGSWSVTFPLSQ